MRYAVPPINYDTLRRHLIYELVPSRDLDWRASFDLLVKRIDLFDGVRMVAVSCNDSTATIDDMRKLLARANCDIIQFDTSPTVRRESSFWDVLRRLCGQVSENDLVWYGRSAFARLPESGGQRSKDNVALAHRLCLCDVNVVDSTLNEKMICGPLLTEGASSDSPAWWFQGACYWFRAAALFERYHNRADDGNVTSETWPSLVFDISEATCLQESNSPSLVTTSRGMSSPLLLSSDQPRCDVIVTSHNYGHFLAECLDSVRRQSPALIGQIVVVDDTSTDNTALIAAQYDVNCLRVNVQDPHRARAAGYERTSSPLVLFLDADNLLADGYLHHAADRFVLDPHLAVVYMDLQYFGESTDRISMPRQFSRDALARGNFMDTGCIARREALDQVNPFRQSPCAYDGLEDWYTWRRLFESGNWRAEWQSVPLLYRRHGTQRLAKRRKNLRGDRSKYYWDTTLCLETVTVFTTLSHRVRRNSTLWDRRLEWLKNQQWPRCQLRLCIANTSHEPTSIRDLQLDELSGLDGISLYNHFVGFAGLEDANRHQEQTERQVQTVVAAIYNRMLQEVRTEWCLIIEDDVFPQQFDLIDRLLSSVEGNTIAIAGAYRQRYCEAWSTWDLPAVLHQEQGHGVVEIGGSGFGCLLLRLSQCRDDLFQGNTSISRYYDVDFFVRAQKRGLRAKVDWSVVCDHV